MFEGSMVAMVTPFKNGKIDFKAYRQLIDRQIKHGTSVIVPCGTTGESATLSHEEHDEVIRVTVEHVNRRVRVLAGAGSNSTAEAVRLHQACEKFGADGALHLTPYYNKPTQTGLLAHFKAIAESSALPLVLYNVPGRTAVNIQAETVARLSEFKNIVGIKEASGSLYQASEIIKMTPRQFLFLSGEDAMTYPLYCLGARGSISVTCNVDPQACSAQYKAVQNNDFAKAKKIHFDLWDLHRVLFLETNPIPVKAALAMMNLIKEEYRLPLTPLAKGHRADLQKVLKASKLI